MDDITAVAIIGEAKSRNMIDVAMPSDQEARQRMADDLLRKALAARENARGTALEAVNAIVGISEQSREGVKDAVTTRRDEDRNGREFYTLRSGEKLPVPSEIEGEVPHVPVDLTELSDRSLRQLYSACNAVSQRARWACAVEEGLTAQAKRLLENARREARKRVEKTVSQPDGGVKPKLVDDIAAEIEADDQVRDYLERLDDHEDALRKLKALRDGGDMDCERISREGSLRDTTFQHEGGLRRS